MNLSFAGCGFLGIYHVGVAVCFKKYAPHLLLDKISGASAGALAACCLLCDMPLGEMTSDFFRIVAEARSHSLGPFSPSFNIQTCLLEGLQKFLPPNAHLMCNGKLHISLTRVYDGKNVIVSQYNSREDLLQALLCACFIPMFSGLLPPRFHGIRYMDGAFSDNLPLLDENTVTVSPFCGESDICPRDNSAQMFHLNWANTSIEVSKQNMNRFARILFPPKPEILSNMCQRGFDDGLRFLHRNNLISCTRCLAVQSTFVVSESTEPAFEAGTERKNEETVIDNIEEYDPECKECVEYRKNAMRGAMPETVLSVFQSYIEQANKGLMNWVFRHRSAKLLAAPLAVPADIFCATLTNLVGDQYEQQHFHYLTANTTTTTVGAISASLVPNFLSNTSLGTVASHCAHRHPVSSRFSHSHCSNSLVRTIGAKSTTTCVAQLLQISNDGGAISLSADRIITITPTLRHQLQSVTQYILKNIHNLLSNSKHRKKIANLSCQLAMTEYGQAVAAKSADFAEAGRLGPSNSVEFYNESQLLESDTQPHSHQHQHQADMDTFEHILDISSNQDAVYAYYYLDENNKVKVTEIFDCTDDPALMTKQEQELNQSLEFDSDWQASTESALLFTDSFTNAASDQLMIDFRVDDEDEYSDIFNNASNVAPTQSHFRIEEITNDYDEDDKFSQPEADQETNFISDYVRSNLLSKSSNDYSLNNG